jgi:hypothetical protein
MRHLDKPWLKLGMSRATWYRRGKPTTRPRKSQSSKVAAAAFGMSLRTFQRTMRVFTKAPELGAYVRAGHLKIGQAERLLTNPEQRRRFWMAVER